MNFSIQVGLERPEGHRQGDLQDLNHMRKEIFEAAHDSALICNCMRTADYSGMSAEDRYTLLAYEALVMLESYHKRLMQYINLTPQPPFISERSAVNQTPKDQP
jgi:hypothetical protein